VKVKQILYNCCVSFTPFRTSHFESGFQIKKTNS